MFNKNTKKGAFLSSLVALVLCCSMFVGTTFAWFTDEVTSGMNTIAAGNLDVELLANGEKVNSNTKLFDDVDLWEPGVVVYENIQVANVGTLALKYQMTLNFGNENNLNGHKLSEVLKIAVIDKIADNATREEVLAAAKASENVGTLNNFYQTGMLAPKDQTVTIDEESIGDKSTEQTVVIFWEPNSNEVDNLYNVNNGQETSDKKPLHIEFGVHLVATQLMSEEDSFGNDYDKLAANLPKATVNNNGAQTVFATKGIGGSVMEIDVPFVMQFLPNETYEEAQASQYRYWHADYVVSVDHDVPAESMALVGYYNEWCQYNNDNWVALTSDADIDANTEIRLVETLGATVNYEEICEFGNDGIGFLCSAADLTGENAGTTITVELRLYETTGDPATTTGPKNEETGNYEVVGTYSYTFGTTKVSTAEELTVAVANGGAVVLADDIAITDVVTITENVTIDLNGYDLNAADNASRPFTVAEGAKLTINAEGAEVDCGAYGLVYMTEGTLTINGGTFTQEVGNNGSFVRVSGDEKMEINLNNVTYKAGTTDSGVIRTSGSNVTVNVVGGTYEAGMGFLLENGSITGANITATNTANMWPAVYADGKVTVSGCTIKSACHAIAVGGGNTVTVENCDVQVDDGKLAFQVFSSGGTINVVNCTYNGSYGTTGKINSGCPDAVITIDGTEVYRKSAA